MGQPDQVVTGLQRYPLAGAAALQAAWGLGVWSRAMANGWDMGNAMLKLQAEALSPIHAAALANAERLKS